MQPSLIENKDLQQWTWNLSMTIYSMMKIWCVLSFSLSNLGILLLMSQKTIKESLAFELAISIHSFKLSPFSVVLLLDKKPKESLTLIWKPFWSLRSIFLIREILQGF